MPFTSLSTQFPGGFTNAATHQTMSEAGTPDPTWSQMYHNDFNNYVAGDFTLSGAGTPTYAASGSYGAGGVIALTTTAANNDAANIFQPVGSFQLTTGKHQFFKTRLQVPAGAAAAQIYAGLAVNGSTAVGAADGLFFFKAAGGSTWVLRSIIGSATTDIALPAACVIADATWVELGFHVDAQGNVEVFFNPTTGNNLPNVGSGDTRGRVASLLAASITQARLAVCAGVVNGAASARVLAIDYLTVSAER